MTDSALATASYVINYNQVQTPTFSPLAGHYAPGQLVTISCSTSGSSINYTLDGSTPTSSYGTSYTVPIIVNTNETIKAIAYKATMNDSNVASAVYTMLVYTNYLYVNNAGGNVAGFKINADGSLTPLSAPTFASGGVSAAGIVVSPNGSFLYTSGATKVQAWSIGAGGLLTLLGQPLASGTGVSQIAITPNGSFLYVANEISGNGSAYSVAADGTLAFLNYFSTGTDPVGVAVTPNGSFLFVTDWGDNTVYAFSVGPTGALAYINDWVPYRPTGLAVSPNGLHLYVTSQYSPTSYVQYATINTGGSLTAPGGSNTTGGGGVYGVAVSPNGSYLYVANNGSGNVAGFSIATDGTLTALSTPTFATGSGPLFLAFSPDGSYLYVANNNDSTISAFSVGSNGILTSLGAATYSGGTGPQGIVTALIGQ